VRSRLERVAENAIRDAVTQGWGLEVDELRYLPEGGGAYHWIAHADDGQRWFVTCDDLDSKPWLGKDRDTVFDGLGAAYGAAMDLRVAGCAFVVTPIAAVSGAPAQRVDDRHTVAVFDYVDGEPGQWGRPLAPRVLDELVTMLAWLHRTTPAVRTLARRGLEVPGRDDLEEALSDLGRPWHGGPLSEGARRELAMHVEVVLRSLADLDRFAIGENETVDELVVTHGEPHPGNIIRTANGLVLVDWDTVALARPERDLWMLANANEDIIAVYRDLTGVRLDRDALRVYRLLWALTDVAAFTIQLRREHRRDADAAGALRGLRSILNGREPCPYGTLPT
jgi:spectinomycin phosphotransferase